VDEAFSQLSGTATALLVVRGEHPAGIITKLDLLEFLAHRD
jgi:predicted transcriptional regulator